MSEFPPPFEHGEILQLFDDIFFVTGAMAIEGRPLRFSRNMVIVRENGNLTLINTVRLTDAGLAALESLGQVRHVIRLAGYHGRDDAFYKHKYGATVLAVRGQVYVPGFELDAEPSFQADQFIDDGSDLPIADARLVTMRHAKTPEGLLLMLRDGGVLVAGDTLQNWSAPDRYFSLMARLMMRLLGFIKPFNVGPGWLKAAKPSAEDLENLLEMRFEHVLPAHGDEVIGGAREKFAPAIRAAAARLRTR